MRARLGYALLFLITLPGCAALSLFGQTHTHTHHHNETDEETLQRLDSLEHRVQMLEGQGQPPQVAPFQP